LGLGHHLDMLLQVLRTLEALATEVAFVGLQWDVDSNVRCYVVALYCRSTAKVPAASQVKIISAFSANMALTDVLLKKISCKTGKSSDRLGIVPKKKVPPKNSLS
jgi:hypothetical protein